MRRIFIPLFVLFGLFNISFSQYNSFTKLESEFIDAFVSSIKESYIQNQTNPLPVSKYLSCLKKEIPSLAYAEILLPDKKVFSSSKLTEGNIEPQNKDDESLNNIVNNRDSSKLMIYEYNIDENNKVIEFSSAVFSNEKENKCIGIIRFAIKKILDRSF